MALGRGFGAVQEAIAKANEAGNYTPFVLTHPVQQPYNMSWKDGETKVVRFLSDDLLVVGFHNYFPTRDGKHNDFVDTEDLDGDLCRPDYIKQTYKNEKGKPKTATKQGVALVIQRELNPATKEYEDVTDTFQTPSDPDDPNSEKIDVVWPRFWVIKQGMRFWAHVNAYWSDPDMGGTIVNRNFKITRSGSTAQGTSYSVIPIMKEDGATTASLAADYDIPAVDVTGYSDDFAQTLRDDPITGHVYKWIERKGTEQHFEKVKGPKSSNGAKSSDTIGKKAAEEEPSEETVQSTAKVSNLKDRLAAYKK